MTIAFTSTGATWNSLIDPRFGRTAHIVLYNEENEELRDVDNTVIQNEAHGAGTATAQKIFELHPNVLITGNGPGDNASKALKHMAMKIFVNAQGMSLRQAYEKYKHGELTEI
ncbi:MAG: dinitrogenase iron-molybdenum cofactor biosynthesis protein [Alphaproteobacteria bacterium]|nr:dinitrogenase iron-molybdenum cofactor biosynthesis protein [Alphaproteobacteria bacterium]